jgi:hypothetical protein
MNDPDLGPIFNSQRMALGGLRMEEFMDRNANLQFMAHALVLSIASTPGVGYHDTAIECIKKDAEDLRGAANAYADWALQLAEDWRAQRQEPH